MPFKNKKDQKRWRRRYYLKNKKKIIAKTAQWQKDNPEKHSAWRFANREKLNAGSRDWYRRNKKRVIQRNKIWRKLNPDKTVKQARRYRDKHKDEIKASSIVYREQHKERDRKNSAARRRELKLEVFAVYGNRCKCCGESNIAFLTIDHVNNDGAKHRRENGRMAGYALHVWLKRNGFPKKRFRLLCWNCNVGRYYNGGVCPHKTKKKAKKC